MRNTRGTLATSFVPKAIGTAVVLVGLVCLPIVSSGYAVYIANLLAIYVILALGLNLLIGEAGLFGLAHVAFYGIGIYTAGLLNNLTAFPFFVSIMCGAFLAAIVGFIVGAASLRLRDIYLALSTFAFGEAMQWVFLNWEKVTHGANGLRLSPPHAFGLSIVSGSVAYYIVVSFALAFVALTIIVSRSRFGRAFRAVRESEPAAQAVGINLRMTKIGVFTLSAFYAGAAGGIYTIFASFIHPNSLGFMTTIMILTMIVVGGLGKTGGAIIGALFLGLLSEFLRQALSWQEVIYGLILIIFMMYLPRGLWGLVPSILSGRRG